MKVTMEVNRPMIYFLIAHDIQNMIFHGLLLFCDYFITVFKIIS